MPPVYSVASSLTAGRKPSKHQKYISYQELGYKLREPGSGILGRRVDCSFLITTYCN
jgi:hypothetical protein